MVDDRFGQILIQMAFGVSVGMFVKLLGPDLAWDVMRLKSFGHAAEVVKDKRGRKR